MSIEVVQLSTRQTRLIPSVNGRKILPPSKRPKQPSIVRAEKVNGGYRVTTSYGVFSAKTLKEVRQF